MLQNKLYKKYRILLNYFGFIVRIDNKFLLNRYYVHTEKHRYTNITIDDNNFDSKLNHINVHINYKSNTIYDFNLTEEYSKNIKIDRSYNGDHIINMKCYSIEELNKYLHKIYPIQSRKLKLIRLTK